ncbi:hypothetical protein BST11_01565 [Mycobacterium alsense]|uniref:PE-PPE domain-containing protein n=1 Tax=Mycobacterium alsense TaxID=324058 RepID=A0AA41XM29_9MYCO|nr:PE-PPE domain-containing protein [Mycobacterium alsense]MCV7378183.1 PE-PPE domain-containing protein [Mycobacterium alsense]OQZ93348.1 hypothetical protein BST11_01565 [Mycobacterium alsense]
MTTLVAQPEILAAAAQNASSIGSVIEEARAAAAGSTTSLAVAAEDEVSAITAQFFGAFGQQYQAMLQQATAFHNEFTAALAAAGNAYAQAETQIAATLGLTGGASSGVPFTAVQQAVATPVDAILIMTGSGTANPSQTYINNVSSLYLQNFTSSVRVGVTTAEGLYPFTGVKDLTLDISLARGVTALNNIINQHIAPGTGQTAAILGYSQSSIVASLAMPQLVAQGYTPSQLDFTLLGNPANPNGGLLARFPGLSLPSLGVTFGTSTPSNDFPTTIWTLEYDGFADFPRYPINFLADLNALAGIVFIHGTYPHLTQATLDTAVTLGESGAPNMTTYNMIPTQNLPLLTPLRALPLIGNPLADLIQPDLKALVNWGYGDPNYGWSTSPADIQTPFGFLPPLSATQALGPLLVSGTQQGISDFAADMSMLGASLPGAASSGMAQLALLPSAAIPATPSGIIQAIQSANTNVVGTFTADVSTAYATLLPTADIATAIAISLPSYDVNLFLDGINEAINGNVVGGLMDAFGRPIAANIGLVTLAGGFEVITLVNAGEAIFLGVPSPGPQ